MGLLRLKYHLPLLLLAVVSFFYLKTRTPSTSMVLKTTELRKIAVTGSNGRVGKRVVLRALAHGYHVVGIDYSTFATADDRELGSDFSFLQADLREYNETLKALEGCEAIIHLAGYPNPTDYKVLTHNTNVVISWNVLRAAAELGITRVAQASSVNVITLVYSQQAHYDFFPIDETHQTLPDEPYGLSKVISELQADTIVRRSPDMRVASLRLHYSVPNRAVAAKLDSVAAMKDLWGYVQEDSAAEAFILAVTQPTDKWPSASEAFFIAAAETAFDGDTSELLKEHFPNIPIKEGKNMSGNTGFFDCSKAKELLGWVHDPNFIPSPKPLPEPL
ncbi:hypothetical protein B0H16DRAFT_1511107 [Mycena metata]|uniref:NAD-dependent epimerase/dehydratase domain-containing protein n=1 Tax=Mycena metata TaxID=1033252 RepID=A0AAD7JWA7_9AGAR|nr:hypothetical protein B0H16DRAFT_1511107 [Mycena metata]